MSANDDQLKELILRYKQYGHPLTLSVLETYLCGCLHTYVKEAERIRKKCEVLGYIQAQNNGKFVISI